MAGITQAAAALGRSLGPSVGAPIFAWSEGTGRGWPLNFHFVFDLLAAVLLSLLLPQSIERKRSSATEDSSLELVETAEGAD